MKKIFWTSILVLTIISSVSVTVSNLAPVKADNKLQHNTQLNQVINFEDPAIKQGTILSLSAILGRIATDSDLTQENLNKITDLSTYGNAKLSSLSDLKNLPNLKYVGLQSINASKIIDSNPLESLKNLKEFTFLQLDSQLTSLSPLKDKSLSKLVIHSLPVLDDSEKSLNEISSLTSLDISYMENSKKVNVGTLDSISNLKEITLYGLNLSVAPTLKNSKNLEYVNFSSNDLTSVPDLPHSKNLWYIALDLSLIHI